MYSLFGLSLKKARSKIQTKIHIPGSKFGVVVGNIHRVF